MTNREDLHCVIADLCEQTRERDNQLSTKIQQLKEQEAEIARLQRDRVQQKFGSVEVYLREDCFIKAAEINRLNGVIATQAEQIRMARNSLEQLSLYVAYNGDDWVQKEALAALSKLESSK